MCENLLKLTEDISEDLEFDDLLSDEKIISFTQFLESYPDLLFEYCEGEKDDKTRIFPNDLIIKTFKFEKPLTGIETQDLDPTRILQFVKDLEYFFFTRQTPSQIYISRFRSLVDTALNVKRNEVGLSGKHPDLESFLYGKSLKEIARYCLKEGLYHLIK